MLLKKQQLLDDLHTKQKRRRSLDMAYNSTYDRDQHQSPTHTKQSHIYWKPIQIFNLEKAQWSHPSAPSAWDSSLELFFFREPKNPYNRIKCFLCAVSSQVTWQDEEMETQMRCKRKPGLLQSFISIFHQHIRWIYSIFKIFVPRKYGFTCKFKKKSLLTLYEGKVVIKAR